MRGCCPGAIQRTRAVTSRYSHSKAEPATPAPWSPGELGEGRVERLDLRRVVGDAVVHRDRRAVVRLEVVAEGLGRGEARRSRRFCASRVDVRRRGRRAARARAARRPTAAAAGRPREAARAYGFMAANIWPMKPSGVQLSRPMRAARAGDAHEFVGGRLVVRARTSPRRTRSTTSNSSSANGSASASASRHSSSTPGLVARRRPASNSSGVRSLATTVAAAQGGGDGGVARARGHVEHAVARVHAGGVDEDRARGSRMSSVASGG